MAKLRALIAPALLVLGCARPVPQCPPVPVCPASAAPSVAAAQPSGVEPRASAAPAVVPAPRQKPTAQLFDDSLDSKGFFPRGDAFELGLDGKALDELVSEAERTKSDALIVLKNGQVVAERRFGQRRGPIETMSITKSITALAVTMLIEGGKIASLDEPVSKFIAEFGAGEKRKITLRHLLTQSSGLAHGKDARALNAQKDRTAYALRGKVVTEPGGAFSYNNEATQLLSIVVEKAAGKPIDAFLDERLFRPLGIRGWQWDKDGSGNVQTYYGLALDARDLARIGQMLLDGGRVGDKQLISKEGITKLHAPSQQSPYYGLLWWIRYERVVHEFDQTNLAKLESVPLGSMAGKTFGSAEELWLEAGSRLSEKDRSVVSTFIASGGKLSRERPDQPIGFYADGSLGQRLAIFGAEGLVVVRQRRRRPPAEENEGLSFPSMLKLAHALTAR